MLIKRSWLLMGIVAVTLVGALAFSGCTQREQTIGDDYLFFQKVEEALNTSLNISQDGYAEFTTYVGRKINTHSSGTLSEGDMRELSEFIENSGFFQLKASYVSPVEEGEEDLLLLDIGEYTISVYKGDEIKSVYVFEAADRYVTPLAFKEVGDYLMEEVVPRLKNDPRYGAFIIAEEEEDETGENVLSEEDLEAQPFLARAIRHPGWFIYVGSLDNTELEEYITQGRYYFFVTFEGNKFYVRVIERPK